jgi:hypothetical protein
VTPADRLDAGLDRLKGRLYLLRLREAGLKLRVEDGQVRLSPLDRVTPPLLALARDHKTLIVAALTRKANRQ